MTTLPTVRLTQSRAEHALDFLLGLQWRADLKLIIYPEFDDRLLGCFSASSARQPRIEVFNGSWGTLLHETAHYIHPFDGHGAKFWGEFQNLLHRMDKLIGE